MDIADVRRRNLRALINSMPQEYPDRAALARHLGVSYAELNQIIGATPTRGLGEKRAREWESRLGLVRGWLDHEHADPLARPTFAKSSAKSAVVLRESLTPYPITDVVDIPVYDARPSMGLGEPMPEQDNVVASMRVTNTWVRENLTNITSPKNLKIVMGYGDSMRPTFAHGDPLIADTGVKEMKIDAVYVFVLNAELYIKRIQRLPTGGIKIISDNRDVYDPITMTAEERAQITVLGRIVSACNMRKL